MKKLLKELLNTYKEDFSDESRWRGNSFNQWWHGPALLVGMLLFGYWVITKSSFFQNECPPPYYAENVVPILIKSKVINIKGNTHERHNWLTWVLLNKKDTLHLLGSRSWGALMNTIAINDSILKEPGKLDLVLVKPNGEKLMYEYHCPE